VSEVSDGVRTPDESESLTSDVLAVPEFAREGEDSLSERLQRSSFISNSGRRSATKEMYEDKPRYTSARPVARRSVSRELFDLKYNTGKISPSPYSTLPESETYSGALSPPSRRISRLSREGSSGRDTEDQGSYSRSMSLSRGPESRVFPSRSSVTSSVRSGAQSEMMRNSPLTVLRYNEEEGGYGGNLRDRKRDDWRRISVPERGKDFNSLPRKYTRQGKNSYI